MARSLIHHGGKLREAADEYGIELAQWLDLSTGINPVGWPVPPLDAASWQRLPEEADGLVDAAQAYYGAPHVLPVAGSQAAIQLLPTLRAKGRVGIIAPGYAEHAWAWQRAGHEVIPLSPGQIAASLDTLDCLVLINPNNPSGERFCAETILQWRQRLVARGGWLVVDEAFMDSTPGQSIAAETGGEGLVLLRSLGKFFGLAGVRVGFVLAWPALLQTMRQALGPWTVSTPAREVARRALQDTHWQRHTRERLQEEGLRLRDILTRHGLRPDGGTVLFQWCRTANAEAIHRFLARHAIFTRLFDAPPSLRFGLPADERAWGRLERALASLPRQWRGEAA